MICWPSALVRLRGLQELGFDLTDDDEVSDGVEVDVAASEAGLFKELGGCLEWNVRCEVLHAADQMVYEIEVGFWSAVGLGHDGDFFLQFLGALVIGEASMGCEWGPRTLGPIQVWSMVPTIRYTLRILQSAG